MPTKLAVTEPEGNGIPLEAIRLVMDRLDRANDRSSRPAQVQARENEQKALSLWIKGATFQQIETAGLGIGSTSDACPRLAMRCQAAIVGLAPAALRELSGRLQELEAVTDETNRQIRASEVAAEHHASAEVLLDRALASLEHLSEIAEAMTRRLTSCCVRNQSRVRYLRRGRPRVWQVRKRARRGS